MAKHYPVCVLCKHSRRVDWYDVYADADVAIMRCRHEGASELEDDELASGIPGVDWRYTFAGDKPKWCPLDAEDIDE